MAGERSMISLGELALDEKGAVTIGPFGSRMKAEVYVPSGVPVIRGTNISDGRWLKGDWVFVSEDFARGLPNCLLEPGDLVFPHRGSIGEVAIIEKNHGTMLLSSSMMKFRPDASRADSVFLFYYFRSRQGRSEILKFSSQVGTPGIGQPLTSLRQFKVPLIPLPKQKAIAHILGTLDDKIELNRRMNETLEAMARALFKSWFVDFDPVRAKMDGRQPEGMDKATADLFPDSFEDSPLGKIPKGWKVGPILNEAALLSGGTPSTSNPSFWDGGIPWASAKDVSQCNATFLVTTERTITSKGLENSSTKLIEPFSTVVVARDATTGRMTMFGRPIAMNQTCYGFRCRSDAHFFLYCHVRQVVGHLVHSAHGSVFDTITTRTFETTPVVIPCRAVSRRFHDAVAPIFGQILSNLKEALTLAALRDALLPKLLSGEIRVPEAERLVESRP